MVLLVAAVPLIVVLPEAGVPMTLLGLRLLAVEADWAASAYAWIDWRFSQVRSWSRRQPLLARGALLGILCALAVGIVWLLVVEFS